MPLAATSGERRIIADGASPRIILNNLNSVSPARGATGHGSKQISADRRVRTARVNLVRRQARTLGRPYISKIARELRLCPDCSNFRGQTVAPTELLRET